MTVLWCGVDIGTQSVRVGVYADDGGLRSRGTRPLGSERYDGRHTQSPGDWISAARESLAEAMGALTPSERQAIGGLSICSTSGTIAVWSGGGWSDGLMYDDARASVLAGDVRAADEEHWGSGGVPVGGTWALTKLRWLVANGALAASDRVAHQVDVVAESLAGHPVATDWSHAFKSGYDVRHLAWPGAGLEALGISVDSLPPVVAPGAVLGTTSAETARATGLPEGTPIVAGMTDGCAAQLGAGAVALGSRHTVLGTTLVLKGVSAQPVADSSGAVYSHRSPDGVWLPGGASNVGAGPLAVLPSEALTELMPEVDALWRSGSLPLAYPLVGSGERFPFAAPAAAPFVEVEGRPAELDLDRLGPAAYVAAVIAGVACVERLGYETMAGLGVEGGCPSTTGGGSRNRVWSELRATLLGTPVTVPQSADGARGMAMLAAWGVRDRDEGLTLAAVSARMASRSELIEPRESRGYEDELYGRFLTALHRRGWLA